MKSENTLTRTDSTSASQLGKPQFYHAAGIAGDFYGYNSSEPRHLDQLVLCAFIEGLNGPWWIEAVGPTNEIEAVRKDFDKLLQSLHRPDYAKK